MTTKHVFVSVLVLLMVGTAFTVSGWAFYTFTCTDAFGTRTVTPIVGFQNTSWTYIVANIDYWVPYPFSTSPDGTGINTYVAGVPGSADPYYFIVRGIQCPPGWSVFLPTWGYEETLPWAAFSVN